jgi:hypothetical protein
MPYISKYWKKLTKNYKLIFFQEICTKKILIRKYLIVIIIITIIIEIQNKWNKILKDRWKIHKEFRKWHHKKFLFRK